MKRYMAGWALMVMAAALSGCYYDPGYSYVRATGSHGDAYYGEGGDVYYAAPVYGGGYYDGRYYGSYGPGVSIGISSGWYGSSRYRDHRGGRHRGHDRRDHRRHHDDRSHVPRHSHNHGAPHHRRR